MPVINFLTIEKNLDDKVLYTRLFKTFFGKKSEINKHEEYDKYLNDDFETKEYKGKFIKVDDAKKLKSLIESDIGKEKFLDLFLTKGIAHELLIKIDEVSEEGLPQEIYVLTTIS